MKKLSLVNEIIHEMEQYLERIDGGDAHFNQGVLKNNRGAAHYAIANMIGHAKALCDSRKLNKKKK